VEQLSPRLDEIVASLRDRAYAAKLRKVYLAAAHAIHQLQDIDLLRYETTSAEGAPDLSLWEEMAPIIRDTVMDVNALLMVIREQFPQHPPGGLGDTLSQALEEAGVPSSGRSEKETEEALHQSLQQLANQVTQLGERMRSPTVVSDRWNLIAELQTFRHAFREQIGTLVHATASAFSPDARKEEVVPFYAEDLAAALALRATVADLVRITSARLEKVREAEAEDVQWNCNQLEKELDSFGKTPAYKSLGAQDKRVLIELRAELTKLGASHSLPKRELLAQVEPFAEFVRALAGRTHSEMLVGHDREVCAGVGVALEQRTDDPDAAVKQLHDALARAQKLYGRDEELDLFLRRARKQPPGFAELGETIERFTSLLTKLY
jgi:hypothetical protein